MSERTYMRDITVDVASGVQAENKCSAVATWCSAVAMWTVRHQQKEKKKEGERGEKKKGKKKKEQKKRKTNGKK